MAAERLVEIIKNVPFIGEWLKTEKPSPNREGLRRIVLQFLAVGAGFFTIYIAREMNVLPIISDTGLKGKNTDIGLLWALGFLASGGSGFWTSILGYVNNVKDIKKAEAIDTTVRAAATVVSIAKAYPGPAPQGANANAAYRPDNAAVDEREQNNAQKNLEDIIEIANSRLKLK
ncbi:hypothetical protein [Hymenobacter sp. BT491]|uniref:hypothetical protein n=1 Tax=Hymenobacter sp. BT491 TaxID=2766779 RepID=UPI001653AB94|nr:hypothetical protein [Hymenobacter sp. BT491]MBC6992483.1 hypothetical protein [Hymenobacter sp. BT491]